MALMKLADPGPLSRHKVAKTVDLEPSSNKVTVFFHRKTVKLLQFSISIFVVFKNFRGEIWR